MPKRSAALSLIAATLFACPLSAQEAAGTATSGTPSDIEIMRERAAASPQLGATLEQLQRQFGQNPDVNNFEYLRDFVFSNMTGGSISIDQPVRIATLESLQPARRRAQAAEQVLAADLDGDWQVTRDEIAESLKYGMADGAAQAFLLGDTNQDNVLSTDEIKVAVEAMATARSDRRGQMPSLLTVFDFDDDGSLSQEEFTRGAKALTDQ